MSGADAIRAEIMDLWKSSAFKSATELLPSTGKAAVEQVLLSARFFMRDLEQHEPQLLNALGAFNEEILCAWILQEQDVVESAAGTTEKDWFGPARTGSQPHAPPPPAPRSRDLGPHDS